jgi:hypothetical protein
MIIIVVYTKSMPDRWSDGPEVFRFPFFEDPFNPDKIANFVRTLVDDPAVYDVQMLQALTAGPRDVSRETERIGSTSRACCVAAPDGCYCSCHYGLNPADTPSGTCGFLTPNPDDRTTETLLNLERDATQ